MKPFDGDEIIDEATLATQKINGFSLKANYNDKSNTYLFTLQEDDLFAYGAILADSIKDLSLKDEQVHKLVISLRKFIQDNKKIKSKLTQNFSFKVSPFTSEVVSMGEAAAQAQDSMNKAAQALKLDPVLLKGIENSITTKWIASEDKNSVIFTVITAEKHLRFSVNTDVLFNQMDHDEYKKNIELFLNEHFQNEDTIRKALSYIVIQFPVITDYGDNDLSGAAKNLPGINQHHVCPGIGDTIAGIGDTIGTKHFFYKCEDEKPQRLYHLIMHLNDEHKWTREAIADWIETFDNVPVFETKEEVNEGKLFKATVLASFKPIL